MRNGSCAVRYEVHYLFESLAPVYRHWIRARAAALRGDSVLGQADVRSMVFETVPSLLNTGA